MTVLAPPKNVLNDISHRAHNLARIIDRLSAGRYIIEVIKDPIEAIDWKIDIARTDLVQRVTLSNKIYVPE